MAFRETAAPPRAGAWDAESALGSRLFLMSNPAARTIPRLLLAARTTPRLFLAGRTIPRSDLATTAKSANPQTTKPGQQFLIASTNLIPSRPHATVAPASRRLSCGHRARTPHAIARPTTSQTAEESYALIRSEAESLSVIVPPTCRRLRPRAAFLPRARCSR